MKPRALARHPYIAPSEVRATRRRRERAERDRLKRAAADLAAATAAVRSALARIDESALREPHGIADSFRRPHELELRAAEAAITVLVAVRETLESIVPAPEGT